MLDEYLGTLGLRDRVASIRAIEAIGGQIAQNPASSHGDLARECCAAAHDDGAEAVILGGAGLVGIAQAIAREVPVPVLDGFAEAIYAARELASAPRRDSVPVAAAPPVETSGLGARLAALMSAR